MTAIMMLMGLGMVLGNVFSGKLSSRFSPLRIAATTDLGDCGFAAGVVRLWRA